MTLPDFAQSAKKALTNIGATRTAAQPTQQFVMPEQLRPPTEQDLLPPPDPKQWDYRGAIAGPQGEALPEGAQAWTPFGQPYFGKGIGGTLKKYQWMMFGSPTSGQQADLWEEYVNANGFREKASAFVGGVFGTDNRRGEATPDLQKTNQRLKELKEQYGLSATTQQLNAPPEVQEEYRRLGLEQVKLTGKNIEGATTFETGGQAFSPLTPLLRGSKVALTALMDGLSELSIKAEQVLSVNSAMRDYTDAASGDANTFDFDVNRKSEEKSEAWKNGANMASRVLFPPLAAWDALKFITAPGTIEEKKNAVAQGWDAGKMYYSQIAKPALLEEYKRRVAAGDDPQLAAMALQNPWAEAIGQIILDPLNVLGMMSKAGKAANLVDDAEKAVRGGSLGDEVMQLASELQKGPVGETRAAELMDNLDNTLAKNIERIDSTRLTVDYGKATAYSPSGLRVKEAKSAGTAAHLVTGAIMRNGGTADDVADYFASLAKMTNLDKASRMEGLDEIMKLSNRFGMGRYAFSDDVLETGILLRNLTEDGGDLLKSLRAGNGDLSKTIEILTGKLEKAVMKSIPTVKELKSAAAGTKQAEQYAKLSPTQKALWNINDGKAGDVKNAINRTLGKFYFASPGFVVRNAMNNMFTMLVDSGIGGTARAFKREGKWWSIAQIDEDMAKFFGGELPDSMKGFSFSKSEQAETFISKLNSDVEANFAKRIYWSRFRDQMDTFLSPGVALPSRAEFNAAGFTNEAIDQFVNMVRHNGGNIDEAFAKFAGTVDADGTVDLWRRWAGAVDADDYKGLRELGISNEIEELAALDDVTPQTIQETFKRLRNEVAERAKGAENNIAAIPQHIDAPFADKMNKAAEKFGNVDATQRMNILITKSDEAGEEFLKFLANANEKYGVDPVLRKRFGVMQNAFSPFGKAKTKQASNELWDTFWSFANNKGRNTPQKIWDNSILSRQGKFPGNLSERQVIDALKKATDDTVAKAWDAQLMESFDFVQPMVDDLLTQIPEMEQVYSKAKKAMGELQAYRNATYRGGKIYTQVPPTSVAQLAKKYGIASATEAGVPMDKQLLNTVNKYSDVKYKTLEEANQNLESVEAAFQKRAAGNAPKSAKAAELDVPQNIMKKAKDIPRNELPPEISSEFERIAKELQSELSAGQPGFRIKSQILEGGAYSNKWSGVASTNADWYRKLYQEGMRKPAVDKALEKIIIDKGRDKGSSVEKLKEIILQRISYGDANTGMPPDLKLLQQMGAPEDVMKRALEDFNDITRQDVDLDEAIRQLGGGENDLTDPTRAFYDDAGNLVQPKNPEVQLVPPYVDGSTPIPGEAMRQSQDGIIAALNKVERKMLDNFGIKSTETIDNKALKKLKSLLDGSKGKVTESIAMADKVGKHWRDFALLPYGETRNFDLALSYMFPYQFWYSRTYANWMKRVATDPQVLAGYAKIKDAMAKEHKDSPEWWRYNVTIPANFLGIGPDHPMSFNLEANIFPLYGLTGVDFNDPEKRKNWWTATLDDMGKFGPSLWAPINIATALTLRSQGEEEAAARWAGRLIPQTATIKALASKFFGKPVEYDPIVQMFSGKGIGDTEALDPYERRRVGRAIAAMVEDGTLTEEQAIDLAEQQDGPLWDMAVQRAASLRSTGQITSFLFGVGFKGRTPEEQKIDEFYSKYYRLNNLRNEGLIAPQNYQQGWDSLRQEYPFMDALLLSRKAGPEREQAYAYNVLGRVPPGQAGEIYEIVGVDPSVAAQFYESGGDMTGWDDSKKERFMAGMRDLGAMLAIPEYATKQDWNTARADYKAVQAQMKDFFGPDIQDKIDEYYGMEDKAKAKMFLQSHPEVGSALDFQKQATINNPTLYEYYGGIKTLESYYKSQMYDTLYAKYGEGIAQTWDEYYTLKLTDPKGAARFKRQHPELDRYSKEKKVLEQAMERQIVEFASKLPEADKPELRPDFDASNPVRQDIQDYAQSAAPTFDQWQELLGNDLTTIISDVYNNQKKMPAAVTRELDYLAGQYGYEDGDALLRDVLISMNR